MRIHATRDFRHLCAISVQRKSLAWLRGQGRAEAAAASGTLGATLEPSIASAASTSLALLTRIALSPGSQEEGLMARWEAAPCSGKGAAGRVQRQGKILSSRNLGCLCRCSGGASFFIGFAGAVCGAGALWLSFAVS